MKIAIASDHAAFELKEKVKNYLLGKGIEVEDHGTYSEESVDYPDYAKKSFNPFCRTKRILESFCVVQDSGCRSPQTGTGA